MPLLNSSNLSDSVGQPGINPNLGSVQSVPFTAYVEVLSPPEFTKRQEFNRFYERMSLKIEDGLKDVSNIEAPNNIQWTLDFAQKTARATIHGYYFRHVTLNPNVAPTTNVRVIHSGTDIGESTGTHNINYGGSLSFGQDTIAALDTEVTAFLSDLATGISANSTGLTQADVYYVVFNGVRYGRGGRTFPT